MIKSAIIRVMEKWVGLRLEYLRYIAARSNRLFFKFLKIFSFGNCRKMLPKDVVHCAAIVATLHEDCGECVDIARNLAIKDEVSESVLSALLNHQSDALPEHLRTVCRFTKSTVHPTGSDAELREAIRSLYGDEGLIELAMTIAAARVFPQMKRSLGYSVSCSLPLQRNQG